MWKISVFFFVAGQQKWKICSNWIANWFSVGHFGWIVFKKTELSARARARQTTGDRNEQRTISAVKCCVHSFLPFQFTCSLTSLWFLMPTMAIRIARNESIPLVIYCCWLSRDKTTMAFARRSKIHWQFGFVVQTGLLFCLYSLSSVVEAKQAKTVSVAFKWRSSTIVLCISFVTRTGSLSIFAHFEWKSCTRRSACLTVVRRRANAMNRQSDDFNLIKSSISYSIIVCRRMSNRL